jgi:hypothetical protein
MSLGDEISSVDFESMIGGPLNAVVRAQAQSAQTSIDFIKSVGFNPSDAETEPGKPTMVTFTYDKPVETTDENGNTTISVQAYNLTVPILTMLPIPYLRVEDVTIDFNAKINSVVESTTTSSKDLSVNAEAKAGWGPFSVKLKCNYSNKKSSSSSQKTERTYTLGVHVKAVQDELPAGMEKILGVLENSIKEAPASV